MRIEQSKELFKLKMEYEELKHKHILEEIEALKKAKVTMFVRRGDD